MGSLTFRRVKVGNLTQLDWFILNIASSLTRCLGFPYNQWYSAVKIDTGKENQTITEEYRYNIIGWINYERSWCFHKICSWVGCISIDLVVRSLKFNSWFYQISTSCDPSSNALSSFSIQRFEYVFGSYSDSHIWYVQWWLESNIKFSHIRWRKISANIINTRFQIIRGGLRHQ